MVVKLLVFSGLICAREMKPVYSVCGRSLSLLGAFRCYPLAEYGISCDCGIGVT
jgi:hypothetical protein